MNWINNYCFNNFPNADIKVALLGAGPPDEPVEIKIIGDNPDVLSAIITLFFIPAFYSILFRVNYKDYEFDERLIEE